MSIIIIDIVDNPEHVFNQNTRPSKHTNKAFQYKIQLKIVIETKQLTIVLMIKSLVVVSILHLSC